MAKHRTLSLFICLLFLAATAIPTAQEASAASPVTDFTVQWVGEAPTLTAVATWDYAGAQYEMAVTGIKSELPESKLKGLAEDFHANKNAALTDGDLTDAEKFSHMIPHNAGLSDTWVFEDDVRKASYGLWGDSLQCWAASSSNMLASTGWSLKATNPATGAAFTGEDAVFSYFTKAYDNNGNYQNEGIRMFFEGNDIPEDDGGDGAQSGGLLPGENVKKYMRYASIEESGSEGLKILAGMVTEIKKGAALGICVDMVEWEYKLKADPSVRVYKKDGRYIERQFTYFEEDEYKALPEFYWTFDAQGGVVILTKEGDVYKDPDGNTVPNLSVKKDHLYRDEKTGAYHVPVPENSGVSFYVQVDVERPEAEVDTEHPEMIKAMGNGSHAITVAGYIRNLTEASGEDRGIRALLIADSDNDANIWKVEGATKKEDRPNTYTLCYAKKDVVMESSTLTMTNYIEDGETYICYGCLLYPKENAQEPVPETGDDTPVALWTAVLAGAGLCLTAGKALGIRG